MWFSNLLTTLEPMPRAHEALAHVLKRTDEVAGLESLLPQTQFTFRNGTYTPLTFSNLPSGLYFPFVSGINNVGQVGGTVFGPNNAEFLFAYSLRTTSWNLCPVPTFMYPPAINDHGDFATRFIDPNVYQVHGYVCTRGVGHQFDVPGAFHTFLYDINNAGQLAGTYEDTAGNSWGFVATPESPRGKPDD
jgi:hypothetical protein